MGLDREIRETERALNDAVNELNRLLGFKDEAQENIHNLKSIIIPNLENKLTELLIRRS